MPDLLQKVTSNKYAKLSSDSRQITVISLQWALIMRTVEASIVDTPFNVAFSLRSIAIKQCRGETLC